MSVQLDMVADERKVALDKILRKQYIISEVLRMKLEVANFIVEGHQKGKSILADNRFLHFTAQMYYRNAALDLTSLFDKANDQNKYSFFQITKFYSDLVESVHIKTLTELLEEVKEDIRTAVIFRHNEAAHYNFENKNSLQLNTQLLPTFNKLFDMTIRIIRLFGESNVIKHHPGNKDFDFGRLSNENMFSFNLLLKLARNEFQLDTDDMELSEEMD